MCLGLCQSCVSLRKFDLPLILFYVCQYITTFHPVTIIKKRTRHIRGMNIIMVNETGIFVSSYFTEDESYFTMSYRKGSGLIICSAPYPSEDNWQTIANDSVRVW
mgnify:CR=1 FL=1